MDEESNLTLYEESETALATALQPPHRKTLNRVLCYNCKKRGHIARNCKAPRRSSGYQNTSEYEKPKKKNEVFSVTNETAFNVIDANSTQYVNDSWIMDSGASAHMTYRRDFFHIFEEVFDTNVFLGNNQSLEVKGKGCIKIQKLLNGEWTNATINNVLYVPDLKKNLFSEGVVTMKGMKIVKQSDNAEIYYNDALVASAVRDVNNLYRLLFRTVTLSANLVQTDSLRVWHERLGHINVKTLQEMVKKGLVSEVNMSNVDKFLCEACLYGKQHKLPFKKGSHKKMQPGERVFSDLCGPMAISSVQGARYFVAFKDECSGYRVLYFIKNKTDVLECFKVYNQKIKAKFNHPVKSLHVDNGTEYCNYEFKEYMKKEGIELENTAPYTPEQNGRIERDNRTIVESARAMLYCSGLPKYLWAEAVNTAVYVLNRTPTAQTPNSTPYEIWSRQKPSLGHTRIFGSDAYVHVPDEKRTKLEPKSQKLVFVGYDGNSTNYRLFDPTKKKIIVSRNVIFNEKERGLVEKPNVVKISLVGGDDVTELPETNEADHIENENIEDEINQQAEEREPVLRSQRTIKIPHRYQDYELNLVEIDIPQSYEEAVTCVDSSQWKCAINEELEALNKNKTWVTLPAGRKPVSCKWGFKVNRDNEENISRYKARLCAKGLHKNKPLMFAAIVSRPDIMHAVGVVSRFLENHTNMHWNAVKRIIKYLNGTINYSIKYESSCSYNLVGYADADYAGDSQTRRSTTGYIFKLCNGPVTWASKLQRSVALSTTEAEYVAASNATKECIWLQQLLSDIKEDISKPTTVFIDNQSAIRLIKNPEFHSRTKHIDVSFHFVREKFENGLIFPKYVASCEQQADLFTKALPKNTFEKLRDALGVKELKC